MSEIHLTRKHHLGLAGARKLAFRWAELAEEKLGMECVYEEGKASDTVRFKRSGVHGELEVTKDHFVLDARLGLLLAAFRHRIESEVVQNLDELLAHQEPHKALEHHAGEHAHPHKAKKPPKKKA